MIWFFDRGRETTVCEVRRRQSQFEVAVRGPDGQETVHVAESPAALFAQLEAAPRRLFNEGWRARPVDLLVTGLAPARVPLRPEPEPHG